MKKLISVLMFIKQIFLAYKITLDGERCMRYNFGTLVAFLKKATITNITEKWKRKPNLWYLTRLGNYFAD